jgi:hypothetical protein
MTDRPFSSTQTGRGIDGDTRLNAAPAKYSFGQGEPTVAEKSTHAPRAVKTLGNARNGLSDSLGEQPVNWCAHKECQ